jgi:ABC-2 type transport system ATP-binding protein
MLRIEGLVKSYGHHTVLAGVDLTVAAGEVVGLLGPNGAGKTTLVSVVAGLRPADAGRIEVAGVDAIADPRAAARHLGIAPQDLGIYPTLSVAHNLRLLGELSGLRGALLDERVAAVAAALSLTEFLGKRAGVLSGGQKRRLHTAMALVHEPRVLFLDEPTVGADVRTRAEILEAVSALAGAGVAVVYCTHYLPEIEQLGATVAVLEHGRIVARGSVDELIACHADPVATVAFIDGRTVVLRDPQPGAAVARFLAGLGDDARALAGVEITRPSLEGAYLAITGRTPGADPQEVDDVAA